MMKRRYLIIVIIIINLVVNHIIQKLVERKYLANIDTPVDKETNHVKSSSSSMCTPVQNRTKSRVTYYKLSPNPQYHYEYRYEFDESNRSTNESRLILLLTGTNRQCIDWWEYLEGAIIVSQMRSFGFSVLSICTSRKSYGVSVPIQKNMDAHWIFTTLQIWMKEVYLPRFKRYPRLYIYGLSRGAQMSTLLCRILPVQAQILYIAPGYLPLTLPSELDNVTQSRLINDYKFANWFFFEQCSQFNKAKDIPCPFRYQDKNYFNPVPPTYFIHHKHDHIYPLSQYHSIISALQSNALNLGGSILADPDAIKLHVAEPINLTQTSIQDIFDKWICKSWFSTFFYQHAMNLTGEKEYRPRKTCWCYPTRFILLARSRSIMESWSKIDQENYLDYVNYIRRSRTSFCETVCGKIMTVHAMASHHIENTLAWLQHIDTRRSHHRIQTSFHPSPRYSTVRYETHTEITSRMNVT